MSEFNREWIAALAAPDAGTRAKAAAEIYRVGCDRAEPVLRRWLENAQFALLCGPNPAATVGLAVLPAAFSAIRAAHHSPDLAEVPPEQDAVEFELHFPGGISLDVLTTRDPSGSGAIANFLKKLGEGIQQVEFPCTDVDRAAGILHDRFAIHPVYPQKRPGANGTHVNFFLVSAPAGKLLIELYEPSSTTAS